MKDLIRVCLIGAGRIARIHTEHLKKHPAVQIVGVSDINPDKLKEYGELFHFDALYSDNIDMLKTLKPDAIVVCTPSNTHVAVLKTIEGLAPYIYCEKPLDLSIPAMVEAVKLYANSPTRVMLGFNRRYDRNYKILKNAIDNGTYGKVRTIQTISLEHGMPPLKYNLESGTIYMDAGIHDFDLQRYLAGSDVEEVYAMGAYQTGSPDVPAGECDTTYLSIKFKNGILGSSVLGRVTGFHSDFRSEVFFERGLARMENHKEHDLSIITPDGGEGPLPEESWLHRWMEALKDSMYEFVRRVREDLPVPTTLNDGLQASLIAEAAQVSYSENRVVRIKELEDKYQI